MINDQLQLSISGIFAIRANADFIESLVIFCEIRGKRFYELNHIIWREDASSFSLSPFSFPVFSLSAICRLTFLDANVNMR